MARDTIAEGGADAAERLHRDRYHVAESVYIAEVDPLSRCDVAIDNRDFTAPRVIA